MPPQFLVVGHVVQDLISDDDPGPWRSGGAATYAARLAQSLGLDTAVLTACSWETPLLDILPGIRRRYVPGPVTAIRNIYGRGRRTQVIPRRGALIGADYVAEDWRRTPIVLLGPVAGEVDTAVAACFPGSLVGVGAQGFLREIDRDGRVRPLPPSRWDAEPVLRHARALFVSDEDLPSKDARKALARWSAMVEIVAFTRGDRGAEVCHRGQWRHIDPFPTEAADPTGAGDVFAAAFLIRLRETDDVWDATRYAACAASFVVEDVGAAAIPDREEIEARLRDNPEIAAR
jgi:hypothetical protein